MRRSRFWRPSYLMLAMGSYSLGVMVRIRLGGIFAGQTASELSPALIQPRPREPHDQAPRDKNCTPLTRNGSGVFSSPQRSDYRNEND